MDLSPNDVRNYEFPGQMRGYDRDEVDGFKEQVAAALETAKQENLKLSMEIDSLKSQLSGLKQFEETIKNAAIDARRNADMTVANAKQEAELIVNKAKTEAEKELTSRHLKAGEIEEQITKLELTRKSYLSKIRSLIQSHLQLVDEIVSSEGEKRNREDDLEITDSSEVSAKTRETIATQPSRHTSIKTEEANAPDEDKIAGLSDSTKMSISEAIKGVLGDEQEETSEESDSKTNIDPELAAALENYKPSSLDSSPDSSPDQPAETPSEQSADNGPEVVETTRRAEEIPEGFVAKDGDEIKTSTDRVAVSENAKKQPVAPESLAKELDEVVAKFEEEMSKAEKS